MTGLLVIIGLCAFAVVLWMCRVTINTHIVVLHDRDRDVRVVGCITCSNIHDAISLFQDVYGPRFILTRIT